MISTRKTTSRTSSLSFQAKTGGFSFDNVSLGWHSRNSNERAGRLLLMPWLKFLWEVYRTVLETFRNNSKVEHLYKVCPYLGGGFVIGGQGSISPFSVPPLPPISSALSTNAQLSSVVFAISSDTILSHSRSTPSNRALWIFRIPSPFRSASFGCCFIPPCLFTVLMIAELHWDSLCPTERCRWA